MSNDFADGRRIARIVLLGFMTSGKSRVGEALARRLEWSFLDFDVAIEEETGHPVGEIVDAAGEGELRRLEAELSEEALRRESLVVAPGGGWITQPELLESMRRETLSVWLKVSPDEVLRRLREDPRELPLKSNPDALQTIVGMLGEREHLYRLADVSVPTDRRSVEDVAFEIEQLVRTRRGSG